MLARSPKKHLYGVIPSRRQSRSTSLQKNAPLASIHRLDAELRAGSPPDARFISHIV
jgi:hypothetical protein